MRIGSAAAADSARKVGRRHPTCAPRSPSDARGRSCAVSRGCLLRFNLRVQPLGARRCAASTASEYRRPVPLLPSSDVKSLRQAAAAAARHAVHCAENYVMRLQQRCGLRRPLQATLRPRHARGRRSCLPRRRHKQPCHSGRLYTAAAPPHRQRRRRSATQHTTNNASPPAGRSGSSGDCHPAREGTWQKKGASDGRPRSAAAVTRSPVAGASVPASA
jgi:hypothetical protein